MADKFLIEPYRQLVERIIQRLPPTYEAAMRLGTTFDFTIVRLEKRRGHPKFFVRPSTHGPNFADITDILCRRRVSDWPWKFTPIPETSEVMGMRAQNLADVAGWEYVDLGRGEKLRKSKLRAAMKRSFKARMGE